MSKKKQVDLTDLEGVIRGKLHAVQGQGFSLYELAHQAGITPSQLSRFDRAERSLSLETAGRLCKVLGLFLVDKEKLAAAIEKSRED